MAKGIYPFALHANAILTDTEHDKCPIAAHEYIQEKAKDQYCRQALSIVRQPGSTFNLDRNGCSVLAAPIDGTGHKVIPTSP